MVGPSIFFFRRTRGSLERSKGVGGFSFNKSKKLSCDTFWYYVWRGSFASKTFFPPPPPLSPNPLQLIICPVNNEKLSFPTLAILCIKALANKDTLLWTHCSSWCFLGVQMRSEKQMKMNVVFPCCANWETFVADTKCFSKQNQKHFLCAGHKICVRNKCCTCGQTGKHLCWQQCVHNNVSSFARVL